MIGRVHIENILVSKQSVFFFRLFLAFFGNYISVQAKERNY